MNNLFKVLFALALSALMATPALAGFKLYGSIRMTTFYLNAKAPGGTVGPDGKDTYQNLTWTGQRNSRLGAKFSNGNFSGRVELGLKGNAESNFVYTRHLYGVYKFAGGSLLVGQTYSPYVFLSTQVALGEYGFLGWGATDDLRQPQIKLTLDNGLYLDLINPKTVPVARVSGTLKSFLPKVALGFNGRFQNLRGGIGFAYNGYSDKDAALGFSKTINSYFAYLHGVIDLKPFDLGLALHFGQNLKNFGIKGRTSFAVYDAATNGLQNTCSYGSWLQLGYLPTPKIRCNAGVGYVHEHNKLWTNKDIAKIAYFVNTQIHIAKDFMIVPEVDYFQYFKGYTNTLFAGDAAEHAWTYGAKWQMDF